jgi:8-oxo-dGTP pyrophosphatase MutT (NUDIX family)
MKHLFTITDKDINGSDKLSPRKPRIAAGVVLFDDEGCIALSHIGIWDIHMLPGGGVDDGENFITAVNREVWEECGCKCEVIEEIGKTYQNSAKDDFVQEKYYYLARVVGEKSELHLEEYEIESKTTVRWCSLERAIQAISENNLDDGLTEILNRRDIAVLNEVASIIDEKAGKVL